MDKLNIKKQIDELREKIEKWNYEYYVLNNPTVEDSIYDREILKLRNLEQQYPEFWTENSPTNRVGGFVSEKFIKRKHLFKMLSLDNAFNETELHKFTNDIYNVTKTNTEFVIEPKIDGLSISLIYENAKLKYALTRGDGDYGEDVTANVMTIKTIPIYLNKKYNDQIIEIRGEIFITKDEFERINNSLDKKFSNPRNIASGTIRNLNSSICHERNLKAYFYYSPNTKELNINSHYEFIEWLRKNNFPVSNDIYKANNIDEILLEVKKLEDKRIKLDYQIDGIVIKLNEYKYYDEIGYTSKFPKWAIAYKFPSEIGLTKLIDITTEVGRTGKITYVGVLEPISLDGSIINKVSLNNAEYIKEKDIRINDFVFIYKAGDIIPYLDFVDKTRRTELCKEFNPAINCPSCETKLVKLENEVDQKCFNKNCETQKIKKIEYYCSRECMNIVGLSLSKITKLYKNKIINSIADLYSIETKKNEIIKLENFQNKSYENLFQSIENSKNESLEKLLNALSINYLGKTSSKKIAKHFKNIDNIINASLEEIISIPEIGEKTAQEIFSFFKNKENLHLIHELKKANINMLYKSSVELETNNILDEYKNKTMVITGSFDLKRDIIKQILEDVYCIKFVSTISKKVDYVILGKNPSQEKINKINQLNIKVIDNIEWLPKIK